MKMIIIIIINLIIMIGSDLARSVLTSTKIAVAIRAPGFHDVDDDYNDDEQDFYNEEDVYDHDDHDVYDDHYVYDDHDHTQEDYLQRDQRIPPGRLCTWSKIVTIAKAKEKVKLKQRRVK